MSTARLLAAALSAVSVAGGAAAIASAQSAASQRGATHAAARGVFVAARGCTGHAQRPRRIVLACADANLYASEIAWRSYGGPAASGSALIHVNDCSPNCVSGHFHTYRSPIRLRRIVRCSDGRRYYSRARYQGLLGHKRWSTSFIKPPLRCHSQT